MKVTKFIHSCLVVEIDDKKIIIDPGNYSYEAGVFKLDEFDRLNYLLITHEHADHMHLPFIKEIVAKFPEIVIITNASVKAILARESISTGEDKPGFIKMENVTHEKLFDIVPPENMIFNIGNLLTHPGDSLHFTCNTPFLALPVQAGWGSLTRAVDFAVSLKPKKIIPIHDWHWNESARQTFYKRLEIYFKSKDIEFIGLETGDVVML